METVLLARRAMATRFELVLHGVDARALRAAGEEALDEIERLEGRISPYQPTSEIADVNALASREPVRVSPEVFTLLERAVHLSRATDGAFDLTVGPLMRCWGLSGRTGRVPDAEELAEARQCVGMHLVDLDSGNMTVRFDRPGVVLDLGALGKGYAIDRAVEILRDAGVTSAFIHGGTSTAYGLGTTPDGAAWQVALDWPQVPLAADAPKALTVTTSVKQTDAEANPERLATIPLSDEALSVSAPSGKSFRAGDKVYGHVIDPRSGTPVAGATLAGVAMTGATETDALSTALLTIGISGHDIIGRQYPNARTLVAESENPAKQFRVRARGITVAHSPRLLLVD